MLKKGTNFTKTIKPNNEASDCQNSEPKVVKYDSRIIKHLDEVKKAHDNSDLNRFSLSVLTYLKQHNIQLTGDKVQIPVTSLANLRDEKLIDEEILKSVENNFAFENQTHIQACAIPNILQNKNFIGIAPTGSGKTLAYLMPICQMLGKSQNSSCLIIAPTFELSVQIYKVCLKLIGKKNPIMGLKIAHIQKVDDKDLPDIRILISTPHNFLKQMEDEKMKLFIGNLKSVVLDEADKFFELSFMPQLEQLLTAFKSTEKQYVLVSATFPQEVEITIRSAFVDRTQAIIGGKVNVLSTIDQKLVYCTNEEG